MHLYNEIIKLRPDWHDPDPEKGAIKIVMTGSASDKALLRPHIYDGKVKKRLEKRFKDPADSLRLVIVRDMWLTLPEHRPVAHQRVLDAEPKALLEWAKTVGANTHAMLSHHLQDRPDMVNGIRAAKRLRELARLHGESHLEEVCSYSLPLPKRAALRELCYAAFAVLHSGETKTPVYVAQRLNRKSLEDAHERRADKFFADARLPAAERAELSDYKHSGYSRGHMAPAGDMATPTSMAQSFSLANMVPQNAQQNGGSWARIEQDTRKYVLRASGDVYVITGPVFVTCPLPPYQSVGSPG